MVLALYQTYFGKKIKQNMSSLLLFYSYNDYDAKKKGTVIPQQILLHRWLCLAIIFKFKNLTISEKMQQYMLFHAT